MSKIKRPQLMTISEIKHYHDGECIWSEYNIPNIWHNEGQTFLLSTAFDLDSGVTIPTNYYLGLDNRTTLAEGDTLTDLTGEPTSGGQPIFNGYNRQALSATTGFVVGDKAGTITATSAVGTFVATVSQWGPVTNLFLTTTNLNPPTGHFLVASGALGSERTVVAGDFITVRINLSFGGCTP
jgi:hypothetical protein